MPKVFGIIGNPVEHSFSPQFFSDKFKRLGLSNVYKRFELPSIKAFNDVLKSEHNLSGLNVTSPYKEVIIEYLDELSPIAQEIQAVNTIEFYSDKLIGHNTDVIGFDAVIKGLNIGKTPCLILGTGGASKAVQFVLNNRNIPFLQVSRNNVAESISYSSIDTSIISKYPVVINTTPVGMGDLIGEKPPIPYQHISTDNILIDLIYKPRTTAFLEEGLRLGSRVKNGYQMLIEQAEASWEIWNSR